MKHTQNFSHYGLLYILRECSSNVCVWRANPCVLHNYIGVKDVATIQYMNKLANIRYILARAITADNHLRDLRRLFDQAEANIRSLRALGVEPESYGTMLSSVLLSKLPPELRLIVSRKVPADNLDMGTLLEMTCFNLACSCLVAPCCL